MAARVLSCAVVLAVGLMGAGAQEAEHEHQGGMRMYTAMSDTGPYNISLWQALFVNPNATNRIPARGPDVSKTYPSAQTGGWQWSVSVRDDIALRRSNATFDVDRDKYVTGTSISLIPPMNLTAISGRGLMVMVDPSWRMCAFFLTGLSEEATEKLQNDDGTCSSAISRECIQELEGTTSAAQGAPGDCRCPVLSDNCLKSAGFDKQPSCIPLEVPLTTRTRARNLRYYGTSRQIWERDPRPPPGPSWCEEPCFGKPPPGNPLPDASLSSDQDELPSIHLRDGSASQITENGALLARHDGSGMSAEVIMDDVAIRGVELSAAEMVLLGRYPVLTATDEPHDRGNNTAYDNAVRKVWPVIVTWDYDGNVTGNSVLPRSYLSCLRSSNVTGDSRLPSTAGREAVPFGMVLLLGVLAIFLASF